jgi:hypothetical protein
VGTGYLKKLEQAVVAAGGYTQMSRDGHLKVFSRSGRFIVKVRTHGNRVGDGQRNSDRALIRQIEKRVKEEAP